MGRGAGSSGNPGPGPLLGGNRAKVGKLDSREHSLPQILGFHCETNYDTCSSVSSIKRGEVLGWGCSVW